MLTAGQRRQKLGLADFRGNPVFWRRGHDESPVPGRVPSSLGCHLTALTDVVWGGMCSVHDGWSVFDLRAV